MDKTKYEILGRKLGKEIINFDDYLSLIEKCKKKAVDKKDETSAKHYWTRETIVSIHKNFTSCFRLLKGKEYYEAWRLLERIEIDFGYLKRHYDYSKNVFNLKFIERAVYNLQVIYPYRLFSSHEILHKRKECSICGSKVSIRNPCGHVKGEIYKGEMCVHFITDCDLLGVSIVDNPVDKFAVLFLTDEKTGEKRDHYEYDSVDYLFSKLIYPYQYWDLNIISKLFPHSDYLGYSPDDYCPCGDVSLSSSDERKYGNCCLPNAGVKGYHYEFIFREYQNTKFQPK